MKPTKALTVDSTALTLMRQGMLIGLNLFKTLKCNHFAATSPLQFYYKYVEKSSFRLKHYNFFGEGA